MRGLKQRRVLITGGASGIGAATASRFLEEGAVVCVLDRDGKGRESIKQRLPQLAGTVAADGTVRNRAHGRCVGLACGAHWSVESETTILEKDGTVT